MDAGLAPFAAYCNCIRPSGVGSVQIRHYHASLGYMCGHGALFSRSNLCWGWPGGVCAFNALLCGLRAQIAQLRRCSRAMGHTCGQSGLSFSRLRLWLQGLRPPCLQCAVLRSPGSAACVAAAVLPISGIPGHDGHIRHHVTDARVAAADWEHVGQLRGACMLSLGQCR
jgi:hypothetical protein